MSTSHAAGRVLFESEQNAVLCTLHGSLGGWPFGSVVPYAVLPTGDAVVFLSDIAEHTKNLARDPRACLFVADPAMRERPQGGARLSLLVRARRPAGAEEATAEALYFARFPAAATMRGTHGFAVWILEVDRIRWIAGFGSMGWIDRAAWTGAPDPLGPHAAGIVAHMNGDHADAVVALVGHLAGIAATKAVVTGLDRGGFDVEATDLHGDVHAVRLPFPQPVDTQVDTQVDTPGRVRQVVMAMVGEARQHAADARDRR